MYVDEKSSGSNPQRSSEQLLQDIERALESAGVSGDVLSQVTQSLKGNGNGNGRATPIATIGELIISDNARTILEERYLRKDADGNAIEAPEDLFHHAMSHPNVLRQTLARARRCQGASSSGSVASKGAKIARRNIAMRMDALMTTVGLRRINSIVRPVSLVPTVCSATETSIAAMSV